jgi:peptidoglycan/xylan/chitin deacetylase (PgdA/CDA1 family)
MIGSPRLSRVLGGYALAAALLPLAQIVGRPATGWTWAPPVAVLLALATAALVWRSIPRPTLGWLGGAIVLAAAWLIPQASAGPSTLDLGVVIGLGLGLATPPAWKLRSRDAALFLGVGVLQFILLALLAHGGTLPGGGLYALAMLMLTVVSRGRGRPRGLVPGVAAAGAVLLTLLTAGWIGANSLTATWFGRLVNHGPRQAGLVAITFDDGPDARFTPLVRDVLDRYGVKGTFFTVGKALDARPDIARALVADGHLLGNHSYHHDALRWLEPGYPELDHAQRAFKRRLGVCPTFFRPPHGQHTPFMARAAAGHRMTMVGWDVSARDWATSDSRFVARKVLSQVRPGSIILLHDGIDGNLHADRSVVVRALPLIVNGLRARGLRPVRLDRLLRRPAYRGRC